ncbi:MAG: FtsX-like permease family protein [Woeseiaceae bacterium]|nr:FtsX-like permease family protein [Woeseiaceae bacterium]
MRILIKLAWRNLFRNHRRTLIMLSAITVGVWAMIFMTAMTQGMVSQMVHDGISVIPGHVQARNPNYGDDPTVNNLLPVPDSGIAGRLEGRGFSSWSTRLSVPAVISSERESRGVTLLGIDPEREADFTFVDLETIDGRYLEGVSDQGVLIGAKLLERLKTRLGNRIVLMSQTPDNDIADRGFRIVGVFNAKVELWEETWVLTGKETLQTMLGVPDQVTEAIVFGDNYRQVDEVADSVGDVFDNSVSVQRWTELDRYLGTMLEVMDGFTLVWVVVIFLALSFGLVNTLVMAVFERVREIGLMLALGMRPSSILGQIVIESMLLLIIGLALGNVLAWLSVSAFPDGIDVSIVAKGMEMMGASSILMLDLRLQDVVLANSVVLILGFLASLSPAWRASRYDPIEAIHKVD